MYESPKEIIMTKKATIIKIVAALDKLPIEKAQEVADYAFSKYEEHILQSGIEKLVEQSRAFQFLISDEDLYDQSIKDKF